MMTDVELISDYARNGSDSAFTELVRRHIDLVYSAALREAHGNAALAQDITQAVFSELARKAARLSRHPALAGWLYTSVRLVGANCRRADERRQRRELEAQEMNELLSPDPSDPAWQQIRPVLDDAMHELNDADRTAVVLRFFQDRSLKEVGQVLGLNENAARMRVDRALEKLRAVLAQRGISSTASGLAAMIVAGAVLSAPSGLAAVVATSALAGTAATSTTFTLIKFMTMTKLKISAVSALVVAAVAVPVWQETRVKHFAAENSQLKERVAALPGLQQEVDRLRQTTVNPAELERLRNSERKLQAEVAGLRAKVGSSLRSAVETAQLKTDLLRQKQNLDSTNTNQLAGAMSMVKGMMEQQVTGQLGRMKAKLNLSPEQEQAIKDILMKQADSSSQAAQKMLAGKLTKEEMADLGKSAGNPEDQIKALLSPAQLSAYQDYKTEENTSNARLAANGEMLMMQSAVGLTQAQQDQVFPILYDQNLKQLTNGVAGLGPKDANVTAQMEHQLDLNVKALEGVLTSAQLDGYRQYKSNQFNMIKGMLPQTSSAQPGN
jgi:RNA polymerase sigma factor (sigma-70 family)